MPSFLVTVRDELRETECTSTFEGEHALEALTQSIAYFSAALERPAVLLRVVSLYAMEESV